MPWLDQDRGIRGPSFHAIRLTGTRELLALYYTGIGHRYTPTLIDTLPDLHNVMLFPREDEAYTFLQDAAKQGKLLGPNFNALSPTLFDVVDIEFNIASPFVPVHPTPVEHPKPADTAISDATGYVGNIARADERGELVVKDMGVVLSRLDTIEKRLSNVENHLRPPSSWGGPR